MANKLKDGALGKKIVAYFEELGGPIPIWAECLSEVGKDQVQYRLTFDNETVSDWLITFEVGMSLNIDSAELFNEVI